VRPFHPGGRVHCDRHLICLLRQLQGSIPQGAPLPCVCCDRERQTACSTALPHSFPNPFAPASRVSQQGSLGGLVNRSVDARRGAHV
jgi:hypothetical protein